MKCPGCKKRLTEDSKIVASLMDGGYEGIEVEVHCNCGAVAYGTLLEDNYAFYWSKDGKEL